MTDTQATPLTPEHIRQSNLIENIDDPTEDERSLRAWLWLIQQPRIGLDVVLELHRRVTCTQLGEEAGRLRRCNVQVGGYVAPRWREVRARLESWLRTMRVEWADMDPRQGHVDFEMIHPFVDGNGRTGRLLMWWHEVTLGRTPTLLRAVDRWDYYEWFRPAQAADLHKRMLMALAEEEGER